MEKKIKILILGIGQSNFLNQLYTPIVRVTNRFDFSINGYRHFSVNDKNKVYLPYSHFHNFDIEGISKWNRLKSFIKFSFKPFFWGIILFELSQNKRISDIFVILKKFSIERYRVKNFISPHNYDVYHFHFCIPRYLKQVYFLPRNSNVICSFWGSDLMRTTGVSNIYYMRKFLKRATKITLQSPEMAEMFYCKYGREFSEKVEILRFNLEKRIFNEIDSKGNNDEVKRLFKKEYAIPEDKFIVALGHNAFPENNHIKMIKELARLPEDILNSSVFILHLSYGGTQSYLEKLKELREKNKGSMQIIIIKDFLEIESMALLRSITDLLIQMPITDALSAAMTEVLYAGNIVIAGSWLPYGILRRRGVNYVEVESFKKLTEVFRDVYSRREYYKNQVKSNSVAIRNSFFPEQTTPEWIRLFHSISKIPSE